jgi:2,3-bisphosphoglycerate-dependent phosphoglycerate mutase
MAESTVYLLRHAQSSPSQEVPEAVWGLSGSGKEQADILAKVLVRLELDRIFSSPYRRAIDTVTPYCRLTNSTVEIEEDLRERKLKEQFVEDHRSLNKKAWQDFSFALPNCESGHSCQCRIASCISRLEKANRGQRILVSSHGNAIGLYLNTIDPTFGFDAWERMKNPDLYKLVIVDGIPDWDKTEEILCVYPT